MLRSEVQVNVTDLLLEGRVTTVQGRHLPLVGSIQFGNQDRHLELLVILGVGAPSAAVPRRRPTQKQS